MTQTQQRRMPRAITGKRTIERGCFVIIFLVTLALENGGWGPFCVWASLGRPEVAKTLLGGSWRFVVEGLLSRVLIWFVGFC